VPFTTPPEIDVDDPLNVGELHAENVADVCYSGIVDDDVGSAEVRDHFLGVGQHRGRSVTSRCLVRTVAPRDRAS